MSDVNVKVGADNSALNTGLAHAKEAVDNFKEKAGESFNELGKDLLGAFAVTAIVESIKGLFEEFSKVQDLADKLGTSAESVQRLGVVAKSSGLDVETLTKALQKGTKNAFEAATGNKELDDAFAALGISAKEFANLAPEQQLTELSEAYEKSGQNAQALDAISKALGKTGLDLIPVLSKGPEELTETLNGANVASNETVAKMKEVTESFEKTFGTLKAYGAEALGFLIDRAKDLGAGMAAIVAFVSNLSHGYKEANRAANEALRAYQDIKDEEAKAREEKAGKKSNVDTDAIAAAKERQEQQKRDEEELGKLKEQNAKKEEEAHFRSLELLEKQKQLEKDIADLKNATPANDLEAEKNKGKILDYQKELDSVNKEVAREKEREEKRISDEQAKEEKERAKEALKEKKDALKAAEQEESRLEKLRNERPTVDSLRQIGGGIAGVNYKFAAAKDDLQKQQVDYAKQQVQQLEAIVAALESQQSSIPQYDGSFTG